MKKYKQSRKFIWRLDINMRLIWSKKAQRSFECTLKILISEEENLRYTGCFCFFAAGSFHSGWSVRQYATIFSRWFSYKAYLQDTQRGDHMRRQANSHPALHQKLLDSTGSVFRQLQFAGLYVSIDLFLLTWLVAEALWASWFLSGLRMVR